MVKEDIKKYKENTVEMLIEKNKGIKNFRRHNTLKKEIVKIKNKDGETLTNRNEILKRTQEFYQELYNTRRTYADSTTTLERQICNVGSEDIPPINENEVKYALHKTKGGKAPGNDQILPEMIKEGGSELWKILASLFNLCLSKGEIPDEWENAVVVLLHKKGDTENLENYRPISLLSQVYKLFTRIILNRLENKFDIYILAKNRRVLEEVSVLWTTYRQ